MKEIPMYLVSAFSERPFAGNPAAVCLLDAWLADDILLKMAQEHNQSENRLRARGRGVFLRWFTTRNEVNLCGHATLASAHVIFHHLDFPHAAIHFATASGRSDREPGRGLADPGFPGECHAREHPACSPARRIRP